MIFSFALTSQLSKKLDKPDPLLNNIKTVTRRTWSPGYASRVIKQYHEGKTVHDAWSMMPYARGAKRLGAIALVACPYLEKLEDMPNEDVVKEGDLWNSKEEFIKFVKLSPNDSVWVVRFEFKAVNN